MSRPRPPFGLRLVQLRDRLVLHDLTFALKSADPSSRNALIDAANSVHARSSSPRSPHTSDLLNLDLPTPPSSTSPHPSKLSAHRYLVLPFAKPNSRSPPAPFETSSPVEAGISVADPSHRVDVVPAFLGLLPLHTAVFAVFATHIRPAASLPSGAVFAIAKVTLLPLSPSFPSKEDKEASAAVAKLLESGSIVYSLYTDISNPAHGGAPNVKRPFHWNFPLVNRLPSALRVWAPVCIYGFIATHRMRVHGPSLASIQSQKSWTSADFLLTLISRRSRRRAGTRFITRGVDAMGDVANFVETEQLVWRPDSTAVSSFLIIRGSIPVFWRQDNGIARPAPQLDGPLVPSRRAFARHFETLTAAYSNIVAVSLVDFHGSEGVLAQTFAAHFDLLTSSLPRDAPNNPSEHVQLVPFDFHAMCAGKEYERGLATLLDQLRPQVTRFGFFARTSDGSTRQQTGVFRVNCVDCLDRTNVVQSLIARVVLGGQLRALFSEGAPNGAKPVPTIDPESEDRFKHVWGDNADAVSKQYSGTGALKTDFTRTGKRSTTGVIGDGVKSVMRMYYKNFVDEGRQEVIDILCGNAVIRQQADSGSLEVATANPKVDRGVPSASTKVPTPKNQSSSSQRVPNSEDQPSLWYSFEAMRINAGGDRQSVYVELHDEAMYVTTTDGICFEYPRKALLTWSKIDEGKLMDRKVPSRLRLTFRGSHATPPTASPLDLQFRGGATSRENFLRALVSWAKPEVSDLLLKTDIRVRVLASTKAGGHRMEDWGLNTSASNRQGHELVAILYPDGNEAPRAVGLGAVPLDVDSSNYVVVAACSVGTNGPAIAVLASAGLAPSVMTVNEDCVERNSPDGLGGAAAVSVDACGTTFGFVCLKQASPAEISWTLSSLKLGRQTADVTNQFHHFFVGGLFGNASWSGVGSIPSGPAGRKWNSREDDSICYTLDNSLSVIRNSFPTLRFDDTLSRSSLWREGNGQGDGCFVALAEGIVDGRRGPELPKTPSQCVVTVTNFRGEDIQLPRGVEPSAQLSSVVVLNSEHASLEGTVWRSLNRPISYPECREALHIPIIPSDREEVHNTFVIGQIAIPTTLGEPVPAGHFVIPLSLTQSGKTVQMEFPTRIGGQRTGRVYCSVRVDVNSNTANLNTPTTSDVLNQDLPVVVRQGSNVRREQPNAPESLQRTNSSVTDRIGGYASTLRNTSMDDVNDRLDAARKKGAKQMKSVVNRLSSFLNQPSLAPVSSLPGSMTTGQSFPPVPGGGLGATPRRPQPASIAEQRHESVGGANRRDASQQRPTHQPQGFGDFQSAPTTNLAPAGNDDLLLKGLRQASGGQARSERKAVPAHVSGDGDLLLKGLREQQGGATSQADDDGWGTFESALPPAGTSSRGGSTNGAPSRDGRQRQTGDGPSLIDF